MRNRLKSLRGDRYLLILILLFVVTLPVGITPWVYSDGVGDYAWVRSVIMDGDLDCTNEFVHFVEIFKQKYGWPEATNDLYPVKTRTGIQANKYPIGTALLWSPFFLLGHAANVVLNKLSLARYPLDGYSPPYVLFVTFGSALYGFLGLLLSFLLARRYFPEKWAFWSTLGIWFASSVPVYLYLYPSMPHNTALFTVAAFVYYFLKTQGRHELKRWAILGVLGGLMILTRLESFVLFLLPPVEMVYSYRKNLKGLFAPENAARLGVFGTLGVLTFLPQMLVWKRVFGRYFLNSYSEMARLVNLEKMRQFGEQIPAYTGHSSSGLASFIKFISHPDLGATLIGSSYGIFTWTPILLLATIGLFFLLKGNRYLAVVGILGAFLLVYITSCSHKQGMSFGDRYLIKASPFFILGFAAFLERAATKLKLGFLIGLVFVLISWNGLFIVQYATGLVNRSGPIDWKRMVRNQITLAPRTFWNYLGPFLTGRSNVYKGRKAQMDLTGAGDTL